MADATIGKAINVYIPIGMMSRLFLTAANPYNPTMNEPIEKDRRVVRLEDFTDRELQLIARAEVPAKYAYLDSELTGWMPPSTKCGEIGQ
jgi:hypothetical protein